MSLSNAPNRYVGSLNGQAKSKYSGLQFLPTYSSQSPARTAAVTTAPSRPPEGRGDGTGAIAGKPQATPQPALRRFSLP